MVDNFPKFGSVVNKSFQSIVKNGINKVFEVEIVGGVNLAGQVDINGDALYAAYIESFPVGTNPVFKNRTEHDCSCCRQFIRRAGSVVSINEATLAIKTVWDEAAESAPYPYNEVATRLRDVVRASVVSGLYCVGKSEASFGTKESRSLDKDSKAVLTWNHFYTGEIPLSLRSDTPDKIKGDYRTASQVFERGLVELNPEAIETVLSLINSNALYRGEEHKPALLAFQKSQQEWRKKNVREQELFVILNAYSPASRLRNSVIGTLVQDLTEGKELEHAVGSFEAKVAPQNYKRTSALVTPGMVKKAMQTIQELGLESALERRFARNDDVLVTDLKWVDSKVKPLLKGGLADILMEHVSTSVNIDTEEKRAETVGIDLLVQDILPTATQVSVFLRSTHLGNLVSLTAPVSPEPKQLFRWSNDFAWSYVGGVADSELRRAVQSRGGRVDGAFRFSHSWNYDKRNTSLMDLHVFMPGSSIHKEKELCGIHNKYGNDERVGWNHRQHNHSGGIQDVDYTQQAPVGYVPVENITYPDLRRMPEGKYLCKIHNWQLRQPTDAGFRAEIEFGGQVYAYERLQPLKHHEWVAVATVTLKSGAFTIEHHMPCGSVPQSKWGLKTEQYVKVNAVTLSPNYWGENAVGNKHVFFFLDGAKNPDETRGIYNEFLHPRLEQHRKVFELIGEKTKCQPTEGQLSGIGFSSTKHETVLVKVTQGKKQRLFNVKTGA